MPAKEDVCSRPCTMAAPPACHLSDFGAVVIAGEIAADVVKESIEYRPGSNPDDAAADIFLDR